MKYSHEAVEEKVRVTHTLRKKTRNAVQELVMRGEVRDESDFIEEAVQRALYQQKLKSLELELEAFDNEALLRETLQEAEDGIEDMANALDVYEE